MLATARNREPRLATIAVRTDTFLANVTLLTTVEVEVVVAEEEEAEVVDMVDAAVMYAIYLYILSFISNF